MYYYHHWFQDQEEKIEFYKNFAYTIGSFIDPQAVAQLTQAKNTSSSDDDFEKALEFVKNQKEPSKNNKKRGRRKKIV